MRSNKNIEEVVREAEGETGAIIKENVDYETKKNETTRKKTEQ